MSVISKKEFLICLKIGETHAALVPFEKTPVCCESLKIWLSGWKVSPMQKITTDDKISSNPGLLLYFKLLKDS